MDGLSINPFDAVVLVILLVSAIVSLSRGFTTEALSLAALGGAIFLTLQGHPLVAPYAYQLIRPEFMADILTYALLGVLSLVLLKLIASTIGKKIKESHVGAVDRGLGVLFGLARGILLICFFYLLTTPFISEKKYPDWFLDSRSRPLVQYGASMLNAINPYKEDMDFEERRKDIEALQRLKNMVPSFPAEHPDEPGYREDDAQALDELFKKHSKE
tara:strand:- start:3999 stop:4646 length:648 start_codon:yes stop_codon:yes gene_type:complete